MLSSRNAYRISLAAGIVVLSFSILDAILKPVPACGDLPSNYAPIIAFEMARSVADLQAIFGETPSECRTAITKQLDSVNVIDCLLYIPAYGVFLVFCFLGMRSRNRRLGTAAALVTIAACAADYAENLCLFRLSANPDIESQWLTHLAWTTEIKWVGLGIASAIGAAILWNISGWWRLASIACSFALVAALITIINPAAAGPYLSLAFSGGWIIFFAVNVHESLRKNAANPEN
jgi:hypothetical protein